MLTSELPQGLLLRDEQQEHWPREVGSPPGIKTCGSLLAALDVHPRVAMQILRHSKIAVTMEIYTEVPAAATRDALRKLGQWLGN
jgi:hypothetical protein